MAPEGWQGTLPAKLLLKTNNKEEILTLLTSFTLRGALFLPKD
jgi:hypothetical protein